MEIVEIVEIVDWQVAGRLTELQEAQMEWNKPINDISRRRGGRDVDTSVRLGKGYAVISSHQHLGLALKISRLQDLSGQSVITAEYHSYYVLL